MVVVETTEGNDASSLPAPDINFPRSQELNTLLPESTTTCQGYYEAFGHEFAFAQAVLEQVSAT